MKLIFCKFVDNTSIDLSPSLSLSLSSKELLKLTPTLLILGALFYFSRRMTMGGSSGRGVSDKGTPPTFN